MQNAANHPTRQRRARGFTLIEIMVVVVIMGILASLVVPKLIARTGESKVAAAKVDIATVMQALKLYRLDNQRYPTTELRAINLPKRIAVNSADGYFAACAAGYGLIQAPHYHAMRQLAEGTLVPVLAELAVPEMALTALYPPHRQLSQRVRVFVDWLVELCASPGLGLKR